MIDAKRSHGDKNCFECHHLQLITLVKRALKTFARIQAKRSIFSCFERKICWRPMVLNTVPTGAPVNGAILIYDFTL